MQGVSTDKLARDILRHMRRRRNQVLGSEPQVVQYEFKDVPRINIQGLNSYGADGWVPVPGLFVLNLWANSDERVWSGLLQREIRR
jgi:hypothetical protein